jgi:hypothetical protein
MTHLSRLIFCTALPLALFACSGAGTTVDDEMLATDGSEASAASSQSTHLGNVVFSALTSQDPDKAAGDVAGPPTKLWPAGCVAKAKDPTDARVAHVTFTDCTGPFGLVHLNGEVVSTFSLGAGGALHVDLAGKDLTANGHPITYAATADVTVDGAMRNVKWHGNWTGTNTKSQTIAHTSDLVIVVDTTAKCSTSDGTAVTTVATRAVDTTIKGYKICLAADGITLSCPTGTVTHTGKLTGKSVTTVFDGSDQAKITGPGGNTFDVPLVCTAAK